MKKIIKTFLPIFGGFYNTLFEADEEQEISSINDDRIANGLSEINYDMCEFDYPSYRNDVGIECVRVIETKLKSILGDIDIEFEEVISPKFYNFTNDSINITVTIDDTVYNKIIEIIEENIEEFNTYIKDKYTNRDGFYSFHSNSGNEWLSILKEQDNDLTHKFSSILEFILLINDYTELDLYNDVDTIILATNRDELVNG